MENSTSDDLPKLVLPHSSGARVEIYLQGAHVASWTRPHGEDVLFMSRETRLAPGTPIRGGIPVIFPQFANRGPLPKHGLVRTLPWQVVASGLEPDGAVYALLRLTDSQETQALWPHSFRAELLVQLDDQLTTTLRVANTGELPFDFTSSLHTYLRVGDVREVTVEGLDGATYLGQTPDAEPVKARGPLRIQQETDGVYTHVPDRLLVRDESLRRTLVVEKEGFLDAVVWNPWIERARAFSDLGDQEYLEMLCVEPANIASPTQLKPGEEWSGVQKLAVEEEF